MDEITRLRLKNRIAEQQEYRKDLEQLSRLSPEAAAQALDKRCQYCGEYLSPTPADNPLRPGRVMWLWPEDHGCSQEQRTKYQQAIEEKRMATERQKQEYEDRLNRAGLCGRLRGATFDRFNPRPDWTEAPEVKRRVVAYANAIMDIELEKSFLILYGQYGNGKSHLAAAVIRQFIDAGGRNAYFRNWSEYLLRIQATFNRRDPEAETQEEIIAELQTGSIVVIDDLDKRKPSEWVRSVLYPVLNHRHNANLPTILTFNFGPGDVDPLAPGRLALEEYLGSAVLDRLIGSAFDVIEFTGPSYRSGIKW